MEDYLDIFQNLLLEISQLVGDSIEIAQRGGEIEPEYHNYIYTIVDEFNYDSSGFSSYSQHKEERTEEEWHTAQNKIYQNILDSEKFSSLKFQLDSLTDETFDVSGNFGTFLLKLISAYFENQEDYKKLAQNIISAFIREYSGNPIKYCSKVKLYGIVVELNSLPLSDQIILRKPQKKDFESCIPEGHSESPKMNWQDPSAFLEIVIEGTNQRQLQDEIRKSIILIQLYKVGSAEILEYQLNSESFGFPVSGTIGSISQGGHLINSHISEQDIIPMQNFWNAASPLIPIHMVLLDKNISDHISIAYQHYNNALLQRGIIEQRVASAIMGLEALFLKGNDRSELSYRLAVRISKISTIFNRDPIDIRQLVKESYNIRSTYLHGDQLSSKEKSKLEKKVGKNMQNILLSVLDCLRMSIILNMELKKDEIGKEDFIDLIDDSLVDDDANKKVIDILRNENFIAIMDGTNNCQ
ncbi:HEPN domain-containing protein [Methanogenium organophilum]|uniref:HEPN domain-containing protein n=1 Tax=Methanogenium organophilum TaxID=2199 RepID=A0A9X9S2J2_METOG|nr:HEPN domain-containing protein [Methanogenium organophilum]WAI00556.1 HEPN domain-containing protein [Methanogenium organophilum]